MELNESEPLKRCLEVRTSSLKLRSIIRSKWSSSDTINCGYYLFIFCNAGVIKMERFLLMLIYETMEAAYK
jgi:hypothetical protein